MPTSISWQTIAVRLALTVIAGAIIGFNRGEHGRPAGLRTTLLVCLAASISMIQMNLLMNTTGKAHDSFVVMDLMRLPLGILSGMGFIGAGAILRKDNLVLGVTTAATLWFVTVMGLCFGGGQIWLGIAACALGWIVLSLLQWVDDRMLQDHHAYLTLGLTEDGPTDHDIRAQIEGSGLVVTSYALRHVTSGHEREVQFGVHWRAPSRQPELPKMVRELVHAPGVLKLEWKP